MNEKDKTSGPGRVNLRINEEDLSMPYAGSDADDVLFEETAAPFSYVKFFFAIVLATPVVTVLALAVMDVYPNLAQRAGLREPSGLITQVEAQRTALQEEKFDKWLDAYEKSNRRVAGALEKQTKAIWKLAEKKQGAVTAAQTGTRRLIKVEIPKIEIPKIVIPKAEPPKVIVVRVPSREKFDLAYEKQKILELAGVDLDDPISDATLFNRVTSRDALKELIRSFDSIIAASRDHEEVSDFMKNNALMGKKFASRRLRNLK